MRVVRLILLAASVLTVTVLALGSDATIDPRVTGTGLPSSSVTSEPVTVTGACDPSVPVWKPEVDWNNPPKGPPSQGKTVSSIAEALEHLAFSPREPKGLGVPDFIWVSVGPGGDWLQHITFKYTSPSFGIIRVDMWMDPISIQERVRSWRDHTARNGDPCIRGRTELVRIKGDVDALIGFPPEESRANIGWREDVVMLMVSGPTLERHQVIAIAEKL